MCNKFSYRSDKKELLDESNISTVLLRKNLKELDFLNRTTGGHANSIRGIKELISDREKTYSIADLGCGSGDILKVIANWARENNFRVKLTGVDKNPDVIEYLKIHCFEYPEITGITSDYMEYCKKEEIDIVHCSLFCHHLNDDELLQLFIYFRKNIKTGFIINDLQRYWLPFYSAWLLTRVFNGSELSKNDGPISVLRGFKSNELIDLLLNAGIYNYSVSKVWAFRFLIIGKTGTNE
jgi:SAM-dependent methyltransferase